MLLLLHLQHRPVLKRPFHDVRLRRDFALHVLALVELGPELVEVLELDEVPDVRQAGPDHGGFGDRRGGWDAGCHFWGGG